MATFSLRNIQTKVSVALSYVAELNKHLTPLTKFIDFVAIAYTLCPELKVFHQQIKEQLFKPKDKGCAGKLVEYYLFGKLPNNDSAPDLALGDVKATHIKKMKKGYNAKERLTITNVGSTANYQSLQHIHDNDLQVNKCWAKVHKGVMIALEETGGKYTAQEKIMNERVIGFFYHDITTNPTWMETILDDYEKIRTCVKAQAVSQAGQTFLHIHPHGSKGSSTRAFGFKNPFVTRLICHYTNKPLCESGRSCYFE